MLEKDIDSRHDIEISETKSILRIFISQKFRDNISEKDIMEQMKIGPEGIFDIVEKKLGRKINFDFTNPPDEKIIIDVLE